MPAPSPIAIACSSVLRLLKEEVSYRKELVDEEAKVKILDEKIKSGEVTNDGNDEFMLKQQQMAVEQTKGVFDPLKKRIADAVQKVQELVDANEGTEGELEQARLVLEQAHTAQTAAV